MEIMTWNYRILKLGDEFGIHEVFYDEAAKPTSYTERIVSPRGESLDDFRLDFSRYQEALDKPVLIVTENEVLIEFGQFDASQTS